MHCELRYEQWNTTVLIPWSLDENFPTQPIIDKNTFKSNRLEIHPATPNFPKFKMFEVEFSRSSIARRAILVSFSRVNWPDLYSHRFS